MNSERRATLCVLGIETSCDETGVAVYHETRGLLSATLYSQIKMHAQYGGVVPELASRDHVRKIIPLIQQALTEASVSFADINAVAYTAGPGLLGALLVGAGVAKSLAYALNVPSLSVHHMEGHLLAPFLEKEVALDYPFLALLVSGGHTLLVHVKALGEYRVLGESLDDAAGEAFDKTASLLGLGYPGGAALSALAAQGDAKKFALPRPMLHHASLNFSFSGLKTAVATLIRTQPKDRYADIAASFEAAVVDVLTAKCERALAETGLSRLVVAGGVSANQRLRKTLMTLTDEVYFPRPDFCTDNGAMIAYAGFLHLLQGEREDLAIRARARWALPDL